MSAARRRSQGGFTLIEVLVVVTLLTMLAVIAIPNYLDARKESAKSACISNIKEISFATEQWALEMRKNPNSAVTFEDIQPYLKGSIVCPTGGKTFDDSYTVSIVANEPTCQRDPQDHYWLGSTTVAALQSNNTPSGTTTTTVVNGLIGDTSGDKGGNGKGGPQNNGKGKGGKNK
jgi:general secretion pathway protein G